MLGSVRAPAAQGPPSTCLVERTAPAEGDPTKVVHQKFENGKIVSRTVLARPEYRRNFLDNHAY
jgi:hypothetical protein